MDPQVVARVLTKIAETASETLELQEVFDRVATSVREVIPFDHMGVVRILEGERAVLHATTVPCEDGEAKCSEPVPLSSWSPRLRPEMAPKRRIDDAEIELDRSFPRDADILQHGVRSALWEPFRSGSSFSGGVWMCSLRPRAFADEHQDVLRPIAALLGTAVEHWRIWDTDQRRRQRIDQLETLLGTTLAESLDVRVGIEAPSALGSRRLNHLVPLLPRAEQVGAQSGASCDDPHRVVVHLRFRRRTRGHRPQAKRFVG